MQLTDLKPDDYYYAEYIELKDAYCIVKGTDRTKGRPNLYISKKDNLVINFLIENNCAATTNIRLATHFEIHWLESCIANKEKISYDQAMLTFIDPSINYQQDTEYNNILIKLLTT